MHPQISQAPPVFKRLRQPWENVWKFLPRYLVANSMSMKHNSKYSLHWFQAKFDFTKFSSRFLSFVFIRARLEISASAIERGGPRQPKQKCKQKQIFTEFCEIFHVFSYFFQAVMLCKVFEKSPVTQKLIPERTQSLDVSLMESVESADGKKMERWENNWTHWTKKFLGFQI